MMELSAAEFIIGKFGGLTGTAKAIGKPVTTVQGWKDRGSIPQAHWLGLVKAAERYGAHIRLDDFLTRHIVDSASVHTCPSQNDGVADA